MASLSSRELAIRDIAGPKHVTIEGETYKSIDDVIKRVQQIDSPEERFEQQKNILEHLSTLQTTISDAIESFLTFTEADKAYEAVNLTRADFEDLFQEQIIIVQQNKERRNRTAETIRTIEKAWAGSARAMEWLTNITTSPTFLNAIRSLAIHNPSFHDVTPLINAAVQARIRDGGRGIKRDKAIITGDIENARARKYRKGDLNLDLDIPWLASQGMRIGRHGLLELDDGKSVTMMISEAPPLASANNNSGDNDIHVDIPAPPPKSTRRSARLSTQQRKEAEQEYILPPVDSEHVDESVLDDIEGDLSDLGMAEFEGEYADFVVVGSKRRRADSGTPAPAKSKGCGCTTDVKASWKTLILKKGKHTDATQMKLLGGFVSFRSVCYHHSRAMGSQLGLNVNHLNHEQLEERLGCIYENRLRIGTLKTHKDTFQWWRKAARPPHPSDMLGVYKFQHQEPTTEFIFDSEKVLTNIQHLLGIYTDVRQAWDRDGTINLPIFQWWVNNDRLTQYIDDEFEMYRFHLRRANNRSNYGWQRSQYHSVTQQLMRQDPVYYMAYVALRPDHFWRLVSYPYYTKYATLSDGVSTFFRHIDINIPDAVDHNRGTNMVQGSVSLDNETDTDSTKLIKGFHHHLKDWWAGCRARGVPDSTSFVHRVEPDIYTKGDIDKYGDWTNVPCKAGEARITMATIPHGADPTTSARRRTMLPWFVGLQDDLQTLELTEGGTWAELSLAHTTLTAAKSSPSGLNSMYNTIPYRFPAAVELDGLSALSSALVCRKIWNSPMVTNERNILLGPDVAKVAAFVKTWRANALVKAYEAYEAVKVAEREAFGQKSFFALREQGHTTDELFAMDPDMCEAGDGGGSGADMRFAEDVLGAGDVAMASC